MLPFLLVLNEIIVTKTGIQGKWKKRALAREKVLGHEVELNWSALDASHLM